MAGRLPLLFIAVTSLLSRTPPLQMAVAPRVCMAPCDVRVILTIEPHALNRYFVVQIDGEMFQGTERPLEGDKAPRTQEAIWFKGLPGGDYEVIAVLYRALGKKSEVARLAATVLVTFPSPSPDPPGSSSP